MHIHAHTPHTHTRAHPHACKHSSQPKTVANFFDTQLQTAAAASAIAASLTASATASAGAAAAHFTPLTRTGNLQQSRC